MDKSASTVAIINEEKEYLMQTYRRLDVVIVKGEGVYVYDVENRKYIDFTAGLGVNSLGYGHPVVINSIKEQAQELIHTSNLYYTTPQIKLAKKLIENTFKEGKVFFCNSGAEAIECAIKIIILYANHHKKKLKIVAAENSFHGRTIGALSLTGQEKYRLHFEPLLPYVKFIPYNDTTALEREAVDATAVVLEVVQGEGGVIVADEEFLKTAQRICQQVNSLFVVDEVQTGMGRCGKLFAYKLYELEPDIITLGKGLGGGLPISATIGRTSCAKFLEAPLHASTFGGNPLCCHVAFSILNIIQNEAFLDRVRTTGEYFKRRLLELIDGKVVINVRGIGLMLALVLGEPRAYSIVRRCKEYGFLVNAPSDYILRFLPPLIIETNHIDELICALKKSLIS